MIDAARLAPQRYHLIAKFQGSQ